MNLYISEACYKFNRRNESKLFADAIGMMVGS